MKTIGYIACFFSLLFFIGSCKKTDSTPDYFAFGRYGNYCITSCGTYYSIKNNELYIDTTAKTIGGPLNFAPTPLSHSNYLLAKPIMDSFPKYFLDHPNQTFGCPNCVDQGGYYIEMIKNGQKTYWFIDTSIASLPVEIRAYVTQLASTINSIK